MVCHYNPAAIDAQAGIDLFCAAKAMRPRQRQDLAVQALARKETICGLAAQHAVSRKFVYQQVDTAKEALQEAFAAQQDDATKVLFYLPVTKQWLDQAILGLTLICHSSVRGVSEFCRDLLDYPISIGKVHNVLQGAVEQARVYNCKQDLSSVRIGAHDEIFQHGWPVLVGVDVRSSYCYLMSLEEQRDAETWAIRMLELQDRGFRPEATIADAGSGLRAGQALAMHGTPCRGDVFHALQLVQPLATFLENRAYEAIAHEATLAHKSQKAGKARAARRRSRPRRHPLPSEESFAEQLRLAAQTKAQAIDLAADVATLFDWLRRDILSLAGADYATRRKLYDFVVAELRARQPLCPHRIAPVVSALTNQGDDLLAFADQLDQDLAGLAHRFQLPLATVREVFNNEILDGDRPERWTRDAILRERLGSRFYAISMAVAEVAEDTVRASSVIENQQSAAYLLLPPPAFGSRLSCPTPVFPQPPAVRAEHATGACGKEPGRTVDRPAASPLAGNARLHAILAELTCDSCRSFLKSLADYARGPSLLPENTPN
jgi:hypothetical protein